MSRELRALVDMLPNDSLMLTVLRHPRVDSADVEAIVLWERFRKD